MSVEPSSWKNLPQSASVCASGSLLAQKRCDVSARKSCFDGSRGLKRIVRSATSTLPSGVAPDGPSSAISLTDWVERRRRPRAARAARRSEGWRMAISKRVSRSHH